MTMPKFMHLRRTLSVTRRAFTRVVMLPITAANVAVGGQAVMEGVMMRGPGHWAVALRRFDGEIVEVTREHVAFAARHRWAKIWLVRGVVALGESLIIGFRALNVSAYYAAEAIDEKYAEEEKSVAPVKPAGDVRVASAAADSAAAADVEYDQHTHAHLQEFAASSDLAPLPMHTEYRDPVIPAAAVQGASPIASTPETEDPDSDANPDGLKGWQIAIAFVMAFGFSIALFKLLPVSLVAVSGIERTSWWFVLAEAGIKIVLFCGYLALVGLMPDMKRVFQYHSAEHKAINAWEHGVPLEPLRVNEMTRIHVRCGTAFMLWVFVVAIVIFGIFNKIVDPTFVELLASRVILLPLVAGVSFELIRFAGRHPDNRALRTVMAPGLWMQYLTTRECAPDQCEVAIKSLQLVLDAQAASEAAVAAGKSDGVDMSVEPAQIMA